ncbi:Coronin-7 [Geodia barretti]|uniref:Coronin-7 n=1 Tax=Geodia barretti TaxID=519541 RepID=A0AA35TEQ7_GEOBA|nr:Coronin-7 [Geodia barretti]
MAHLPQDELPSEFDVVVDGTGLVQSILAAALSRAGKSVLHLDRNSYYGELWGSLMHREMQQWMAEHRSRDPETTPLESRDPQPHPPPYVPCEGESVLEIVRPPLPSSVTNLVELIHTQGGESCGGEDVEGVTSEHDTEEGAVGEGGSGDCEESAVGDGGSDETDKANVDEAPPTTQQSSKVTWQSLEPEWRRFNFDLIPKARGKTLSSIGVDVCGVQLIFCRGEMVDLITESSCSRYIEFRAVSGIFRGVYSLLTKTGEESCGDEDVEGVTSEGDTEKSAVGEGGSGDARRDAGGDVGGVMRRIKLMLMKLRPLHNKVRRPNVYRRGAEQQKGMGWCQEAVNSQSEFHSDLFPDTAGSEPASLQTSGARDKMGREGRCIEAHTLRKLPKLSVAVPGDSNGFQLTHTGRQDTDEVLMFQNSANIMDFVFDPFNNHRLVVACDDARIRVWKCQKEAEEAQSKNQSSSSSCIENLFTVNRTSSRTISLYVTSDLSQPLSSVSTTISPATLVPHYDPDTCLLFLSGKGDSSIIAYEYVEDKEPYLFDVAPFACGSPHQAVSYLPKYLCDVKRVEIARAVRLCKATVEPIFFKVPRTRTEYFQDDVYPETRVTWEAALTSQEWLSGEDGVQSSLSLRPHDMEPLSEAPKAAPAPKKYQSYNPDFKTDEEKKEELMSAMIEKMGDQDEDPLPQEAMDGCDSDEWSD